MPSSASFYSHYRTVNLKMHWDINALQNWANFFSFQKRPENQGQDNNESVKIMAVINVVSNYHYQTRIYDRITHTSCFLRCTRSKSTLRSDVTWFLNKTAIKIKNFPSRPIKVVATFFRTGSLHFPVPHQNSRQINSVHLHYHTEKIALQLWPSVSVGRRSFRAKRNSGR